MSFTPADDGWPKDTAVSLHCPLWRSCRPWHSRKQSFCRVKPCTEHTGATATGQGWRQSHLAAMVLPAEEEPGTACQHMGLGGSRERALLTMAH
jgi:hypothetical protein